MLTTHYLEEADALAERVIVIDHGLVIADDTAARLKSSLGDRITMTFGDAGQARLAAERTGRASDAGPWSPATGRWSGCGCRTAPSTRRPGSSRPRRGRRPRSPRLEVVGPTLDDVFLDLTGRSLREVGRRRTASDRPTTAPWKESAA